MSASAVAKRDPEFPVQIVPSSQVAIVDDWTDARKEFIRKTYCGGAPDDIAATFLELCRQRRLSPEARHIYLINRAGQGKAANYVIQTGIDGYRLIADRTQRYAGSDEPVFIHDPEGGIAIASVTVYKLIGGVRCPFTASARWDEYQAGGPMWAKMPHTMLAKCAEALALRKAFPEELSGFYTDAEMDQAEYDAPRPVQPAPRARAAVGERSASSPPSNVGGIKALNEEVARKKLTEADVLSLAANAFGVAAIDALAMPQLTNLRLTIRDCSPDQLGLVAATLAEIAGTDDRAGLDQHVSDVEHSDLPQPARTLLTTAITRVGESL